MPRSILEQLRAAHEKATPPPWVEFIDRRACELALLPAGRDGEIAVFCLWADGDERNAQVEDDAKCVRLARTHMGALLAVCDAAKAMRESQAAWQEVAAFAHMDSQTMKDAERRKFEAVIALDVALAALTQETPDAA